MTRGWSEWPPLRSDEARATWAILCSLAAWSAVIIGGVVARGAL